VNIKALSRFEQRQLQTVPSTG